MKHFIFYSYADPVFFPQGSTLTSPPSPQEIRLQNFRHAQKGNKRYFLQSQRWCRNELTTIRYDKEVTNSVLDIRGDARCISHKFSMYLKI